ncbi:hypothetical protein M1B72_21945 [Geomonas paludis]|nr:hypothetical protein [Geomonas paludis]UPU36067.1 hypothetical protein M1B72_21945 [Geomonas paludis]
MDPRKRMAWDGKYDGSRYVLIGDSAFCSYYVDRPEKTIWARLQEAVGEKVYPGALDGSKPADFLRQGDLISSSWSPGTTVFLNIIPTRFVQSALPEPHDGNYGPVFERMVPPGKEQRVDLQYLHNMLSFYLGKLSFFFREETALKATVDAVHEQPAFFKTGNLYNRNWATESDGFALNRFKTFETNVILARGHKSLEWIGGLRDRLSRGGMKLVVVLTPCNRPLVRSFAKDKSADAILGYLDQVHEATANYLAHNDIDYIDLYSAAGADDFADMLHTNERGDEVIAKELARWIKDNRGSRAQLN